MILYHGSTLEIAHPNPLRSRKNLDFGQGFYLTSFKDQAERWALRKAFLEDTTAIVNQYDASDDFGGLKVLRFEEDNEEWVEFVCACRRGSSAYLDYDVIIGSVANDKVYEAVNMYYKGYWNMDTTLEALSFYEKSDQYCLVSQKAADGLLRFVSSYEVSR